MCLYYIINLLNFFVIFLIKGKEVVRIILKCFKAFFYSF